MLDDWDQITGFQHRDQQAIWRAKITAAGNYRIEVDAICTSPTQEARMRIYVGEKLFVEDLLLLSDNPESVATTTLGELPLGAPETYLISAEMVGLPLIGKLAIREIRLIPTGAGASPLPKFSITEDSAGTN